MIRQLFVLFITAIISTNSAAQEFIKDRKAFIPNRKHEALPGTAVGILLTDGHPVLIAEGRFGPPDQVVFSANGNSYRWVYVPTANNPQITNLRVSVGKNEVVVYPALNLANPAAVAGWGITQSYALVEVEVNGGRGGPGDDAFVATKMRILEGSKDFPLKVADAVKLVKMQHGIHMSKQEALIDQTMKALAKQSLNGREPSGQRDRQELMYVTWMAESATLRVHFRTTISDGAYTMVEGGVDERPNPPALPLPPMKKKLKLPGQVDVEGGLVLAKQPPPKRMKFQVGTTFGIEFGRAYIVNKKGEVVRTEDLPIEPFTRELRLPPGAGIGPRPVPLPLPPMREKL